MPAAEVARVLANRPSVIVVRATKANTNRATERLVHDALARDYRRVGTVIVGRLPHTVYRREPDAGQSEMNLIPSERLPRR